MVDFTDEKSKQILVGLQRVVANILLKQEELNVEGFACFHKRETESVVKGIFDFEKNKLITKKVKNKRGTE